MTVFGLTLVDKFKHDSPSIVCISLNIKLCVLNSADEVSQNVFFCFVLSLFHAHCLFSIRRWTTNSDVTHITEQLTNPTQCDYQVIRRGTASSYNEMSRPRLVIAAAAAAQCCFSLVIYFSFSFHFVL